MNRHESHQTLRPRGVAVELPLFYQNQPAVRKGGQNEKCEK